MKPLPISETYERELVYFPYKKSLEKVTEIVCSQTPKEGMVLDLMCGPGYLLGMIQERRPDLYLQGMDIDERYIDYAREKYPEIKFEVGDVLDWKPKELSDVVLCTGALHHIPHKRQVEVILDMFLMIKQKGFVIVSDCYISNYSNEKERKIAAAELGYEYLKAAIKNAAPDDVTRAAIDILHNDVMMDGEFKDSLENREIKFRAVFPNIKTTKTWPDEKMLRYQYGDYITILRD
jgi:SAM-dependent methyltransferase